jgi:hypothetical protein
MLNRLALLIVCAAASLLAGCSPPHQKVEAGADQSTLVARLGPPKETYDLPNGGKRLMWPTQPMGTTTTAADIDASAKVRLFGKYFRAMNSIARRWESGPGKTCSSTSAAPSKTSYFKRVQREV